LVNLFLVIIVQSSAIHIRSNTLYSTLAFLFVEINAGLITLFGLFITQGLVFLFIVKRKLIKAI